MAAEPEPERGAGKRRPREKLWIALVTAILLAIFGLHTALCWRISEDDAFFLDISWNLLGRGSYSNDTYGALLGHDRMVASIPPAFPVWQTLAVDLYQRSHRLMALKAGQLLLLAVTLPLLWWKLRPLVGFGAALACYAATATDGLFFAGVLSNRYELWCVLACLALVASVEQAAGGITLANGALFVAVALVTSLSNLQLLPLVAAGVIGILVRPGPEPRASLGRSVAVAGLAGALVLAAGLLLATDAGWRDSFQRQLIGMSDYYAPRTLAGQAAIFGQRFEIGAGNLVASNAMHSAGSVVFLALGGALVCWWRRLGGHWRKSAEGRLALFYTALFLAALAPLAALGYVGPRLAPVFLLAVVMLVRVWRAGVIRPGEWKAIAWISVMVNYAGACAVAERVYRAQGRDIWLQYGLLPVVLLAAAVVAARSVSASRLMAGVAVAVVAANLALNAGQDGYGFSRTVGQARRDLQEGLRVVGGLAAAEPGMHDAAGVVIYGDAPGDYLLARELAERWPGGVRFRTFFPFFYYAHPKFSRRFVDGFDADVVLLGPQNRARLERFGPAGEAMLRLLGRRYRESGRLVTSLGETMVLVAKDPQVASGGAGLKDLQALCCAR